MFEQVAQIFSAVIPKSFIDTRVKPALIYAGSKDNPRTWMGIRVFVAILMGIIGFLIPFSVIPLLNVIAITQIFFDPATRFLLMFGFAALGFVGALVLFYLHVSYVIDGRKRMVENILPDFLYLVGNNLKSGMAPFYAFRSAVRPEFGPLSEEIRIATGKSLGIDSFSEALKSIGKRIDSKILSDTTKFFAQALRSGGHLARLIETTAADIKQTNRLKKELVTSTKMYTLFIIFVVLIASPMLLAVSVQFLNVLSTVQAKTSTLSGVSNEQILKQSGIGTGKIAITPDFMQEVSYFLIVTNAVLASVFMGILGGGKMRDGLKYAPLLAIGALILFMILVTVIGGLMGSFVA